jgi:glycosyltransferase involved in cell wall biosynthesis
VFYAIAVITSYFVLTRAPHLTTVVVPDLSKLLDYWTTEAPSEIAFLLKAYIGDFHRIVAAILDNSQVAQFQLTAKPWNSGIKEKLVLLLGVSEISVVVPALNEEKYLSRCLESLTDQCCDSDYEVIVVDGGSMDRTVEIAKHFADRIITTASRPVGAARNEGAKVADGEIVAFIDADTIASRHWLTAIERSFKDLCVTGVTGPTLPCDGTALDSVTYRLWTIYLQRVLLSMGMPHVIGFNCAYRKNAFLRVGGFDETNVTSEDIGLARKMRRLGRIRFDKQMSAVTSARRFRKYGHAYITGLYILNGFSTLLFDTSSKYYPPVR